MTPVWDCLLELKEAWYLDNRKIWFHDIYNYMAKRVSDEVNFQCAKYLFNFIKKSMASVI